MIRVEDIRNKDTACLWLQEKIDTGWKPVQIREMMNLSPQFPTECKFIVEAVLKKIELLESKDWSQKRLIKCNKCGYQEQMRTGVSGLNRQGVWKAGITCPKCSSEEFYPVVETAVAPGFISREPEQVSTQNVRSLWLGSAALILFSLGIFIFVSHIAARNSHFSTGMVVKCENCRFMTKVPLGPTPVKCRKCKEKQMYNAVECAACGTVFTHKQPPDYEQSQGRLIDTHNPPKCPKCGSTVIKRIRTLSE